MSKKSKNDSSGCVFLLGLFIIIYICQYIYSIFTLQLLLFLIAGILIISCFVIEYKKHQKNIIDKKINNYNIEVSVEEVNNYRNYINKNLKKHHAYSFEELFKMFDLLNTGVVFLDTETTGLDAKHDILDIGAILVINGQEVDRFQTYLQPQGPVLAQNIHGLNRNFLKKSGVMPKDAFYNLNSFIRNYPIAGHNIDYDIKMIKSNSSRFGVDVNLIKGFCTLTLSRCMLDSSKYSLDFLCNSFNIQPINDGNFHGALSDAWRSFQLAKTLQEILKNQ